MFYVQKPQPKLQPNQFKQNLPILPKWVVKYSARIMMLSAKGRLTKY